MRAGFVVLGAAALLGVAGCGGGGDERDPLTLEQRFIQDGDAPGYAPDPAEGGKHNWGDVDQFVDQTHDRLIGATPEEAKEFLTEAGFVRAIGGTRFLPGSDGDHSPGDPHLVMAVLEFESEEGARDAVEWYHDDSRAPCPEKCAFLVSELEVDGISDAKGVRRVVTAERLQETGEEGEPFDSYDIRFADGPFAYFVGMFGPPGDATTEANTEAVAGRIHDRVEGAPPAEQ